VAVEGSRDHDRLGTGSTRPAAADRHRLRAHDDVHVARELVADGEAPELAVGEAAGGRTGKHVGLSEELGHPAAARALVDVLGRSRLLQAAFAHDGHAVGQRECLGLIVSHQQGAGAGRSQDAGDLLAQRLAQGGVEGGERLVEEHHGRIGGERTGQRHALPLPAGELVGIGRAAMRELDELQALGDAPRMRRPEGDVALDAQVREQRALLKDHPDAALLGLHQQSRSHHGATGDGHAAPIGNLEAGDDAQESRLARAARPQQRHQVAVVHAKADAGYRGRTAEGLLDVADLDGRRGLWRGSHASWLG
jgi:hypothetical protein